MQYAKSCGCSLIGRSDILERHVTGPSESQQTLFSLYGWDLGTKLHDIV